MEWILLTIGFGIVYYIEVKYDKKSDLYKILHQKHWKNIPKKESK